MASTNKTTHYELSQYVGSDKPTYLGDYNTDMSKIDSAINTAQTKADGADLAATTAQITAETAQTTANTAVTNAATADGKAETAQSRIGKLANLTTTEKTNLVGAINEVDANTDTVNAKIGDLTTLETTTKSSAVAAINELEETKENAPTTLWVNQNPTANFDNQDITLNDLISNYDYFEIICYTNTSNEVFVTSGVIPTPAARILTFSSQQVGIRDFYRNGTNKITVGHAYLVSTQNDALLIPYEVLGYKRNPSSN